MSSLSSYFVAISEFGYSLNLDTRSTAVDHSERSFPTFMITTDIIILIIYTRKGFFFFI